ncbi:MAG: hypothetical protein IJ274_10390, partial [Lachnospiraceae bacterium]|nr:hypothetical protein [Lachnospiraceae bacterium]
EMSEKIVNFLEFVEADLSESERNFDDEFVRKLQKSVQSVKASREMEEYYMNFELFIKEERAEAKAEVIVDLLEEVGAVSDELRETIMCEINSETLTKWIKLAAKSDSVEGFLEKANII